MAKAPASIKKALKAVPQDLPFYLSILTTAGHLKAAGIPDITEEPLHDDGRPGQALIFCPVIVENEETGEIEGTIDFMIEVRANALVTIQQAAAQCGVGYRTIQRWRDEELIFPVTKSGKKQLFPLELVREVARKKGHL